MVKVLLICLCFLFTSLTGVCPQRLREIEVKAGEMVALQCLYYRDYDHGGAKLMWTSYTTQEMDLTNMSSAEQMQMGMVIYERNLVILNASVNHQGNYSCSLGNDRHIFRLTIYTTQTGKYNEKTMYPVTCSLQQSCRLTCPDVNTPTMNILNSTKWQKMGESSPNSGYFSSVEESDRGIYTCTRSYLYRGQMYNMTFTLRLDVQQKKEMEKSAVITSPHMGDVFYVDLGSTVVIDCKAVMYSDFDEVFWLSGSSFVDTNNNLPVFYNSSRESNAEEIQMTAALVFQKVSEKDLLMSYTCKLDTENQPSIFVTITLAQKSFIDSVNNVTTINDARPSYLFLVLGIISAVVVKVLMQALCVKFKVSITLFFRDTLGCHVRTSDGKIYDAFLMCYKSDTDAGLSEEEVKWLSCALEERFGYSLCIYDRDVLPGEAAADAVLDCIEQSRTVVLVPTSPDLGTGSGLLSAIHAALVERQTRLIFIKTEATEASGSLPEVLQLLGEAGNCVTWKGKSSMPPSSSFLKQLRYHLPAPQHAPKTRLSPLTI